jgi:hypothetical protein
MAFQRLCVTIAALLMSVPASASQINSGPPSGADGSFCPALAAQLKLAQFDYPCVASSGTRENIERVLADPRQLSYGQLDAYVAEGRQLKAENRLTIVRQDDVRECLFAVTRNGDISNYGELAAHASGLRFILAPTTSGSFSTFQFLRAVDPDGIAKAKSVTNSDSVESALREALSADDTVSLFVAFPDPARESFQIVRERGGHVVGVIDRTILRQEVDGKKIYFAQETQVEDARWMKSGRKVVTSCTPLVVFTGAAEGVADARERKDHEDLIRTIRALSASALLPEQSLFQRLLKRTKELSADSTEKLLEVSERAREKAKPFTDKALETAKEASEQAKEAAGRASEAAKPYVDKSKEAAQKAYEDALRMAKEFLDKSKSDPPPKKE